MKPILIAIDGPAASGKSTVGAALARRLGCVYFDTGVMYRAVTWAALERHIAIDEIYLGNARKYVTLVVDLESGRIMWVGDGRGGDALREFWRMRKQSRGRLRSANGNVLKNR